MAAAYNTLPLSVLTVPELFEPEKLEETSDYYNGHSAASPVSPVAPPAVPPGLGYSPPRPTTPLAPTSIPASAAPVSYKSILQTTSAAARAQTWRRSVHYPLVGLF